MPITRQCKDSDFPQTDNTRWSIERQRYSLEDDYVKYTRHIFMISDVSSRKQRVISPDAATDHAVCASN